MEPKHPREEWYSAGEAANLSGLSAAMINYLCRQGIVTPSCGCKRGHGARRHYSFGDLVALRLVARLSEAGVSVLRLRESFQRLRTLHPNMRVESLIGKRAVTDGRDIYLRGTETPLERASDGQFVFAFVIELEQISNEVAKNIPKVASA